MKVKTCSLSFISAGYNNLEVAEYLLEHGADVNAQDKGGLIPLHNAASYGVSPTTQAFTSLVFFFTFHGLKCRIGLLPR